MTPTDTRVHLDSGDALLWRIRGDAAGNIYPNKLCAEAAARITFPDESVTERYSRLHYVRYYSVG